MLNQSNSTTTNSQVPMINNHPNNRVLMSSLIGRRVVLPKNTVSPETKQPSANIHRAAKQNQIVVRKISIRRLCILVGVAAAVVSVLTAITAGVIITTSKTTVSPTTTTTENDISINNATTTSITTMSTTSSILSIISTTANVLSTSTSSKTTTTTTMLLSSSTSTSLTSTMTTESTTPTATSDTPAMTTETATTYSTSSTTTSTTSTTTTTTTTPSCSTTPGANLMSRTSAIVWTFFAYNYTAISPRPTLVFGFSTGTSGYVYLDEVSVVDNNAPSIQLLNNPGFDNSTSNLTGWTTWCTYSCGAGYVGRVLANSSCRSGNCYNDHCRSPAYDYLVQSFPATISNIYTISFWLQLAGSGAMRFYASTQN